MFRIYYFTKAGGFTTDRDRAASAAVGSTMLVLGGRVDRQEEEEGEGEEEGTDNESKVHMYSHQIWKIAYSMLVFTGPKDCR